MMTQTAQSKFRSLPSARSVAAEQAAIDRLRELLDYGDTIYTVCRYVSRSRTGAIFAVLVAKGDQIKNISADVADAIQSKWDDCGGVWSNSAFNIVTELSFAIHGSKSKGRQPVGCHRKATANSFKAGYTFEHAVI